MAPGPVWVPIAGVNSVIMVSTGLNLEMPGGQQMSDWLPAPETKDAGNSGDWLMQLTRISHQMS